MAREHARHAIVIPFPLSFSITKTPSGVNDIFPNPQKMNPIFTAIATKAQFKKHDFLHDGKVLENDTFEDYEITSNHDKITLEVIDEQNE